MEEQKVNPRKRKCEVCNEVESKYKCPGCSMQTCSLPCVKEHKVQKNCDGKRCLTEFVRMKDFTDAHLLSDYRLLEDISRCSSNASRDRASKTKSQSYHISVELYHFGLFRILWTSGVAIEKGAVFMLCFGHDERLNMVKQARWRGVDLHLLAIGMSKQKENTSIYHYKEKCLYWRIKFEFVNAGAEFFLPKVQETRILSDILKLYIEPEDDDYIVKYKLNSYIESGINGLNVYMKKERSKSHNYHKLDLSKSIKDNFKNKTIIEYPILYVALIGKDESFNLDTCEKNTLESEASKCERDNKTC